MRLIPAETCCPIGIDPQTGKVDALLIRTDRTAISLNREGFSFVVKEGPGVGPYAVSTSLGMGSQSALSGAGTLFSLYELMDCRRRWLQSLLSGRLSADGKQMRTSRGGQDATIDLAKKYPGFFKDVPGGYYFGCHFANETDPNKGYPFIWVFLSLLRGLNQTLSAKCAHMYLTAFGGWNASVR